MDPNILQKLSKIRHVALDLDGTMYLGSRLFDVSLPFLQRLEKLEIGYTYLTNNSSRSRDEYLQKLHGMGLPGSAEQVLTSTHATVEYLRKELPAVKRLYVLGTPAMRNELSALGFTHCDENPDVVLVGFDMTLDYHKLCRAAWWISQGKPFVASHPDLVCPTDQPTVLVDCGAICRALEAVTNVLPVVVGKPDPRMLEPIFRRHGLQSEQLAMVGDRLMTDIAMARTCGVLAVLVLTGEATRADVEKLPPEQRPDLIVEDVGQLGELLSLFHKR